MSQQITMKNKGVKAHVAYDGSIASVPVWAVATPGVVNITPSADGLSCDFVPAAIGGTDFTIDAEGDQTAGLDPIHLTGHIDVVEGEATTGAITFDQPT